LAGVDIGYDSACGTPSSMHAKAASWILATSRSMGFWIEKLYRRNSSILIFRTVGYGNDYAVWKDIEQSRLVGYDYVLSIEHEDSLMSSNEGASNISQQVVISETEGEAIGHNLLKVSVAD
jgi:hypothetical protein